MTGTSEETSEYLEDDAFFAAIGAAIVAWQSVEREMVHVFSHLLASRAGFAASAVFYHIKNNRTRVEMLDIAARIHLGFSDRGDLLAEWQPLSKAITHSSTLRNQIAHSEVEEELTEVGFKYKLRPPPSDYSRMDPLNLEKYIKRGHDRTLEFKHIKSTSLDFTTLSNDLNRFANTIFMFNHPELNEGG